MNQANLTRKTLKEFLNIFLQFQFLYYSTHSNLFQSVVQLACKVRKMTKLHLSLQGKVTKQYY
jgi:hypothetical protein